MQGVNFIFHKIVSAGGTERGAVDIIGELARRGWIVRVITRRFDKTLFSEAVLKKIDLVIVRPRFPFLFPRKLVVHSFERRSGTFCNPEWKTLALPNFCAGADVIDTGAGTRLRQLQRLGRKPSFFDKMTFRRQADSYGRAKIIAARSNVCADDIVEFLGGSTREKIRILFPSTDTSVFNCEARKDRARIRAEWAREARCENPFFLLFPSNDHKRKGGDFILSALDGMPENIRLVVASSTPLNHPRAVNIGWRRDLEKCYAAADAAVLASVYEPFGRVGTESILCGTPALVSDACGCAEVLSEPGGYVFECGNADSFRNALRKLMARAAAEGEDFLTKTKPDASIHFPFSLAARVDRLLELMGLPPSPGK